jgi:hypothetical protein
MRIVAGLLTVALLSSGCGTNHYSQHSVTGPTVLAASGAVPNDPSHSRESDDNQGPGANQAGAAILKTAAGFTVFGASTITSTGPSVVNGNMGLTPGSSVTGFPPGTLNGTLHINDAATAQAKLDLQAAYNDLAGRPCNTTAPDLNSTLTPGVYCFSSSAQLNTALVLDGQGNPNALFIFQIGSTLTTASNSSVTLTNGASAANVFWQVGSSATLGTNTAFQGTIIAYASVGLNTGASIVNGRAMALNGAVTLDTNVITAPQGGGGGGGGHGKHHHKHGDHGKHKGHGGHGDDGDDDDSGHGDDD